MIYIEKPTLVVCKHSQEEMPRCFFLNTDRDSSPGFTTWRHGLLVLNASVEKWTLGPDDSERLRKELDSLNADNGDCKIELPTGQYLKMCVADNNPPHAHFLLTGSEGDNDAAAFDKQEARTAIGDLQRQFPNVFTEEVCALMRQELEALNLPEERTAEERDAQARQVLRDHAKALVIMFNNLIDKMTEAGGKEQPHTEPSPSTTFHADGEGGREMDSDSLCI